MKRNIVTLFLSIACLAGLSAQGIEFFHGKWSEALEKAKAEDKLIFVDAYASWCGPCKRMSSQVFPDSKSGAFYNTSFVCLKIDMEKPENADFADKYPVGSYPTLLFIDADGKIVLKEVGYRDVDPFLALGKKALSKNTNSADYERMYNEGNRDPQFLYKYVGVLNRLGTPSLKITNEYLATQTDLNSDFNLRFILEGATEADSRVFDLLLKNKDKIAALAGPDAVKSKIELACKNTVKKAISFKDEALLKEAKNKMKTGSPDRAVAFGYESDLAYYTAIKDVKKYLKVAGSYQKSVIKNNASLQHEFVINMLRAFPEDVKVLESAEKMAKSAAENGGLPEYYMTLAGIYKMQGNKLKAKTTAQKAIELIGDKDNGMKARIEYFLNALG
ncbi:MAG: thioredoxin family protein [Saprospiraceae bacterium]|jgi:thiol-disulfide isomerase/thioredoxin